jgi:hypothetical protein
MKLCCDCKWVRIPEAYGEALAQCAAPALLRKPDLVTGHQSMRLCRYLRNGEPMSLFGAWLAPCGKDAQHFEIAFPATRAETNQRETTDAR